MLISSLPNPANESGKGNGDTKNAVLYATTRDKYAYPSHTTPYMVAVNFLNKGNYAINNRPATASEKCFYFLNQGDTLAIKFKDSLPLKTLFIFFNEQFVNESVYALSHMDKYLLDNPQHQAKQKLDIPGVPFKTDKVLSHFNSLTFNDFSAEGLQSCLFDFLASFVKINNDVYSELNKIEASKKATKEELYKRLFVACEFMEDNVTSAINLDDVAAAACMNKFHFLANFKNLYGTTPHRYLIELKLQKAYHLLKKNKNPVSEVCYSIGFESTSSFSNLFKKRFNITPSSLLERN